jgi:excisionase family DNA binding protein
MPSSLKNSLLQSAAPDQQLEFNFDAPAMPVAERIRSAEPLLTVSEACPLFNLKPHILRGAIKIGAIPVYRFGNGRIRLRGSDIARAIEASRTGGPK